MPGHRFFRARAHRHEQRRAGVAESPPGRRLQPARFPRRRPFRIAFIARPRRRRRRAQSVVGRTKAGGTGRRSALIRASSAAFEPTCAADRGASDPPGPMNKGSRCSALIRKAPQHAAAQRHGGMGEAIRGLFQRAGDFEAEHQQRAHPPAGSCGACGRAHDRPYRGALGIVGVAFGLDHGVDALQGEGGVEALAFGNLQRALDRPHELGQRIRRAIAASSGQRRAPERRRLRGRARG